MSLNSDEPQLTDQAFMSDVEILPEGKGRVWAITNASYCTWIIALTLKEKLTQKQRESYLDF